MPKKIEVVVPVQMSTVQKELYRAILTKNYEVLNGGAKQANKTSLLNVLIELRKCSNHPYLLPNIEPESVPSLFPPLFMLSHLLSSCYLHSLKDPQEILKKMYESSGKMTLLHHMLGRLKERGHR